MKNWSIEKTYRKLMILRKMNEDWITLQRNEESKPKIFYRKLLSKKQMKKAAMLVLVTLFALGVYFAIITTGLAAILFFPVTIYAAITFSIPKLLIVIIGFVIYNIIIYLYNRFCYQPEKIKRKYIKTARKMKEKTIVPEELLKVETIRQMLELTKKKGVMDQQVIQWFQLKVSKSGKQKCIRKAKSDELI